jgi:hypothetical protein
VGIERAQEHRGSVCVNVLVSTPTRASNDVENTTHYRSMFGHLAVNRLLHLCASKDGDHFARRPSVLVCCVAVLWNRHLGGWADLRSAGSYLGTVVVSRTVVHHHSAATTMSLWANASAHDAGLQNPPAFFLAK